MTVIYSQLIVLLSLCILLYVPFIFLHGLFVLILTERFMYMSLFL